MSLRTRVLAVSTVAGSVALAAGLLVGLAGGVSAQTAATPTPVTSAGGPQQVPLGRFFGTVTANGTPVAAGTSIVAMIGSTTCGTSTTTSAGSYQVDIQALPGCTPGATVTFLVGGRPASQTGTVPQVSSAVQLNLTVAAATPTPAPATATPAAPPPPPPPPVATARPTQTPVATPTARVPVSPPNTGLGGASQQKPAGPAVAQKPAAPVAQRAGAAAAAPAARVALPNTGAGSLASRGDAQPLFGWLLLGTLVSLLGAGSVGLLARRK